MLALRRCFASRALSMRAPLRFIHTPPAAVTASLQNKGIRASEKNIQPEIVYQPSQTHIYEYAVTAGELPSNTPASFITNTGALANFSGEKMGRVPNEKRVVKEPSSEDNIWWGNVNKPMTETAWKANRTRGVDFLNTKARLYVLDGFVNWDKEHQFRVRIVTTRPYHCAFMRNMLIMPNEEEMKEFEDNEPDFYVFNAGEFSCDLDNDGMTTKSSVNINLGASESMILGTEYAGEMKKGLFSVMHYLMPLKGVVSLHASCNEGPEGDTTLLFGLSGTGKTTLSADPSRKLIGDDEHCWDDKGVFNIEGGCYAKCINLTREAEPEIYDAVRYGAVLENVIVDEKTREVDFFDVSLTENTRLAYPIEFIPSAKIPCIGGHPKNIIFLTCDAFGVLPPVSKLNSDQLMYQFISGYTAKVAGTEVGITDPEATFSACFGAAFLLLHPTFYADLLAEKLQKFDCNAWLVNTGWSGGSYGVGERMSLNHTRRILDGIHDGSLENATMETLPIFDMQVPTECAGVPSEILMPINTWEDKGAYVATLNKLAAMFVENFEKYADEASDGLLSAAPVPNFTEEFTAEVISRGSLSA